MNMTSAMHLVLTARANSSAIFVVDTVMVIWSFSPAATDLLQRKIDRSSPDYFDSSDIIEAEEAWLKECKPENEISFDTGRFYSKDHKHIITASSHGVPFDSLDWLEDDLTKQWILFKDPVRQIKGKITYCPLDQDEIMRRYDSGDYENV